MQDFNLILIIPLIQLIIMRKSTDQTLAQAMEEWLKTSGMEGKYKATAIVQSWREIMGEMIANHTRQIEFRDGVLYVSLDSAALRQELFQKRPEIIQLLNQKAGAEFIKEVVFK